MKRFKDFIDKAKLKGAKNHPFADLPFIGFIRKLPIKKKKIEEDFLGIGKAFKSIKDKISKPKEKVYPESLPSKTDPHNFDFHEHNVNKVLYEKDPKKLQKGLSSEEYKKSAAMHEHIMLHAKQLDQFNGSKEHKAILKGVKNYTSYDGSIAVNKRLLEQAGHQLPEHRRKDLALYKIKMDDKKIDRIDKNVSDAIKMHTTKGTLHVHSGVAFSPEHLAKDGIVHLPAYTSTSLSEEISKNFAQPIHDSEYGDRKHKIHIEIPKGAHALYATPHSEFDHEHEILLHKGAKIKVHPVPDVSTSNVPVNDRDYNEHRKHIVTWHAKLIHDGIKPV